MEQQQQQAQEPEQELIQEQKPYVPRPTWQVWLARIGLVIFLLFLVIYYFTMFSGGGR